MFQNGIIGSCFPSYLVPTDTFMFACEGQEA